MSVGSNLQEMENVVTKGAAASEPMSKAGSNASGVLHQAKLAIGKISVVRLQKTIK